MRGSRALLLERLLLILLALGGASLFLALAWQGRGAGTVEAAGTVGGTILVALILSMIVRAMWNDPRAATWAAGCLVAYLAPILVLALTSPPLPPDCVELDVEHCGVAVPPVWSWLLMLLGVVVPLVGGLLIASVRGFRRSGLVLTGTVLALTLVLGLDPPPPWAHLAWLIPVTVGIVAFRVGRDARRGGGKLLAITWLVSAAELVGTFLASPADFRDMQSAGSLVAFSVMFQLYTWPVSAFAMAWGSWSRSVRSSRQPIPSEVSPVDAPRED